MSDGSFDDELRMTVAMMSEDEKASISKFWKALYETKFLGMFEMAPEEPSTAALAAAKAAVERIRKSRGEALRYEVNWE